MSHSDTPPGPPRAENPRAADDSASDVTFSTQADVPASTAGTRLHSSSKADSTTAVATDQAKQVGQDALAGGQQVAGVAADQAKSVAAEAGAQAKNLLDEARSQLTDQAATQQNNIASWLQSIVDELDQMVDPTDGSQSGAATSLVRQVSERARGAASWLQDHEPSDLLAETSRFARQRPGLFLALAAAGGLLAGRLTRGLTADTSPSGPAGQTGNTTGDYTTAAVTTPAERFGTEQGRPNTGAVPASVQGENIDLDDVVGDDELGLRGSSVTGGTGPDVR
jgi:ElaB/YqjD/DUF883 family membrane-anchored ribosome-binding protein